MNAYEYVEAMAAAHGTEQLVCQDIAKRQQLGMAKYGVSVSDNPLELRQWVQHAYEEALDMAVYLRRIMQDMDKVSVLNVQNID